MGGFYRGKLQEFGETLLARFPQTGKGSGNPEPSWLTSGNSDLMDEHLIRTYGGVVFARSVRRINEQRWSAENLREVVETPQKPKSKTLDVLP